jgi:hypothetical protein
VDFVQSFGTCTWLNHLLFWCSLSWFLCMFAKVLKHLKALGRSFFFIQVNDCLPLHVHVFPFFIVLSIFSFEILLPAFISTSIRLVLPCSAILWFTLIYLLEHLIRDRDIYHSCFFAPFLCCSCLFWCTSVGRHLCTSISMLFVRRGLTFYLDTQGSVFIAVFSSWAWML